VDLKCHQQDNVRLITGTVVVVVELQFADPGVAPGFLVGAGHVQPVGCLEGVVARLDLPVGAR
jgi:hypothetical protein